MVAAEYWFAYLRDLDPQVRATVVDEIGQSMHSVGDMIPSGVQPNTPMEMAMASPTAQAAMEAAMAAGNTVSLGENPLWRTYRFTRFGGGCWENPKKKFRPNIATTR